MTVPTYEPRPLGVARRVRPGQGGGRKVTVPFYFTAMDGDKYPSESAIVREQRVESDGGHLVKSWLWAISKCALGGVWLAIPADRDSYRRIRASIWRSAQRKGIRLTSEYVDGVLYVTVTK